MKLRFPRSARLSRSADFRAVREEGRTQGGRFFVLSWLENAAGQKPSRIGIITSRRVGGAVQRSRARRLLREAVRLTRPRMTPGAHIVLIARRPLAEAKFVEVQAEWLRLARRAAILPGNDD